MLTTTDEYVAAVREVLQEPEEDATIWTPAMLLRYLNWAKDVVWRVFLRHIQSDSAFVVESDPISLAVGVREYDFPEDVLRPVALERVHSERDFMTRIAFRDRARHETGTTATAVSTYPSAYYWRRPFFGVVPTPQRAIEDAVALHYLPALPDMEAGDDWEEFSSRGLVGLDKATILRAAMYAKHLDETTDAGLVSEFNAALSEAISDFAEDTEESCERAPDGDQDW